MLKGSRMRLWIVGSGTPDYVDKLRRRALTRGVMEMIDWKRHSDNPLGLIRECDFGVLPHRRKRHSGYRILNTWLAANHWSAPPMELNRSISPMGARDSSFSTPIPEHWQKPCASLPRMPSLGKEWGTSGHIVSRKFVVEPVHRRPRSDIHRQGIAICCHE